MLRRPVCPTPWAVLAAALLLALPASVEAQEPDGAPSGSLAGTVTGPSQPEAQPLPHAWIEVVGGGAELAALTDSAGSYILTGVPAGIRRVRVHRIGSRPLDVQVRIPAGDTVRLDLELEWAPVPVAGVTVRAEPLEMEEAGEGGEAGRLAELGVRALEAAPGFAESGMGAAARGLAGESGSEPARVLLMRGSTADQKLVLLDGAPVFVPFHLGGLVRSFEPDLLRSARHYVGGAPARYDGGLSYVLDLETRPGRDDGLQGSASLDLVSGGLTLEGPLGESASILAAGRALHDGAYRLSGADDSPYGYGDLLLRADARPGRNHRISVTGFWNREEVRLDLSPPPVTAAPGSLAGTAAELAHPEAARWENGAVSARYRGAWERTGLEVTVAASRYRALLPLGREHPAVGRARSDRGRAAVELVRRAGPWTLRTGASADGIDHASRARAVVNDTLRQVRNDSRTGSVGVHAEGARPLGDDVRVRAGLRADHFPDAGGLRLAPRLSATWLLTDDAELTVAAGRFHELPRGTEPEVRAALGDPAGVEAGRAVYPPAEATHLVLSLDQSLSSTLRLGLEGFVKGFQNLPGADEDVLRSSGLDLRVLRQGEELSGWLGYTLAWYWEPGAAAPAAGTADFAGRHLVTAGLRGRLPSGVGGSVRVAYGDGLPYTSVPFVGDRATGGSTADEGLGDGPVTGDPEPDQPAEDLSGRDATNRIPTLDGFLRLDLEVHADWWMGPEEGGVRLRPYLRVLNAVSRRDALFYYFEPWRSDELRALAQRPVLPVLGLQVSF